VTCGGGRNISYSKYRQRSQEDIPADYIHANIGHSSEAILVSADSLVCGAPTDRMNAAEMSRGEKKMLTIV
jgi:hypothetical protein